MKTVSLKLAKQLNEAGFTQDTEFEWYTSAYEEEDAWVTNDPGEYATFGDDLIASAPFSEEILDLLPWKLDFGDGIPKFLDITKVEDGFEVGYISHKSHGFVDGFTSGKSLSEALAKMWLYLKKKGLI